jgi:hypothetical protein
MKRWAIVSSVILVALTGSVRSDPARPTSMQNCLPDSSPEQRQRCDDAVSEQLKASSQTTLLGDGWRLVKTRDSGSGADAVSVMHTVDAAKSDLSLAGLSLRCGQQGIEVILIMLEPQPRNSRPKIVLTAAASRAEFEASVAQSGEALLLPQAASGLATGDWRNAAELSIEIATKSNPIRGTVPIGGLSAALRSLSPNCAVR